MNSYYLIGGYIFIVAVVASLISWLLVKTGSSLRIKLAMITIMFGLAFCTVVIWGDIQGTPKKISVLDGLVIRSFLIKEPRGDDPGQIWIWVTHPSRSEPMNMEIKYSKKMHKDLMTNEGLRQGRPQKLKRKDKMVNQDDDEYDFIDLVPRPISKE